MDNLTINIGERKIPLRFRMNQFEEMEEEIGNLGNTKELFMTGKKRVRNIVTAIRILGNAGLKHEGQKPDLTEEWLNENMDPHAILAYQVAVIGCLSKDSESQAVKEENENKERDLVLEEIEGKKDPVNSHTGG